MNRDFLGTMVLAFLLMAASATAQTNAISPPSIWENGLGNGFKKNTVRAGIDASGGLGLKILGSQEEHTLILGDVNVGWIFTDTLGKDKWYRGNWELGGELFGGYEVNHENAYLVGFSGSLRYDFACGKRWMPFVEIGGGPTITDIGNPDLSTKFEFNVHGGAGLHWFWNDHLATTFQTRYLHLSNGGVQSPNRGVNDIVFQIGMSWFF